MEVQLTEIITFSFFFLFERECPLRVLYRNYAHKLLRVVAEKSFCF